MFKVVLICLVWALYILAHLMPPLPTATDDRESVWRCGSIIAGHYAEIGATRILPRYTLGFKAICGPKFSLTSIGDSLRGRAMHYKLSFFYYKGKRGPFVNA